MVQFGKRNLRALHDDPTLDVDALAPPPLLGLGGLSSSPSFLSELAEDPAVLGGVGSPLRLNRILPGTLSNLRNPIHSTVSKHAAAPKVL